MLTCTMCGHGVKGHLEERVSGKCHVDGCDCLVFYVSVLQIVDHLDALAARVAEVERRTGVPHD